MRPRLGEEFPRLVRGRASLAIAAFQRTPVRDLGNKGYVANVLLDCVADTIREAIELGEFQEILTFFRQNSDWGHAVMDALADRSLQEGGEFSLDKRRVIFCLMQAIKKLMPDLLSFEGRRQDMARRLNLLKDSVKSVDYGCKPKLTWPRCLRILLEQSIREANIRGHLVESGGLD